MTRKTGVHGGRRGGLAGPVSRRHASRDQHSAGGLRGLVDSQATAMAYGKITGENVYRSAGAPSPSDMEFVLHTLLNKPFGEALQLVRELKETKRFALQDILTELVKRLQEISFPPSAQIMLYKELAELE